jgi:hypothetical protein
MGSMTHAPQIIKGKSRQGILKGAGYGSMLFSRQRSFYLSVPLSGYLVEDTSG